MLRKLLTYVIILSCIPVIAHSQISDSFYNELPDTLRPANKKLVTSNEAIRIILYAPFNTYMHNGDEMAGICQRLEKEINNVPGVEDKVPYACAIALFNTNAEQGDSKKAREWYNKTIQYGKGTVNKYYNHLVGYASINLALYACNAHKLDTALALAHNVMELANADKDTENVVNINFVYARVYDELQLYDKVAEYCDAYLKQSRNKWNDDYALVFYTRFNAFAELYNTQHNTAYADTAKALINIMLTKKGKVGDYFYYKAYSVLAHLEYYLKNYSAALTNIDTMLQPHVIKAVQIKPKQQKRYNVYRQACLLLLGNKEALVKMDTAAIPTHDFETQLAAHQALYDYYTGQGMYKQALWHYGVYKAYTDSMAILRQQGVVFDTEQKYAAAQKEASIVMLTNKNLQAVALRNKIVAVSTAVVLLLVILVLLLYLRGKRQQAERLAERQRLTEEFYKISGEAEAKNLQVMEEQVKVIDNLRKSISKNMHDEVGSSVALLPVLIADAKQKTESPDVKQMLTGIEEEARSVYIQVRDFMHQLNNTRTVQAYDVCALLDRLCLGFGVGRGLQVTADADALFIQQHFTTAQHAEMYRIIKEAVTNCLKHSGAVKMHIHIYGKNDTCYFEIKDNGAGPQTVEEAKSSSGLGLRGMQERVAALNGALDVQTFTSDGFVISGHFPVAA